MPAEGLALEGRIAGFSDLPALKPTARSHLKMDAWNTMKFPFGVFCLFSGCKLAGSFREGINHTLF